MKSIIKWGIVTASIIATSVVGGNAEAMTYISQEIKDVTFEETFLEGIFIEGLYVGGLDKDRAQPWVKETLDQRLEQEFITITNGQIDQSISLKDLGVVYNIDATLNEALQTNREENTSDIHYKTSYLVDIETIKNVLEEFKPMFSVRPQNADLIRENRSFVIVPEVIGRELNVDQTAQLIQSLILKGDIYNKISIVTNIVKPQYTTEDMKQSQTPISSFFTTYDPYNKNRSINVELASKKINKKLLPGETFKFSDQIEPVTRAQGYKEGGVIVDGKVVDGIGGGVCQVSSTLYNSVLMSELKITNRQNHSLPVSYVPLGRDATYAEGWLDFHFKNTSEYPVFIESYCENGRIFVNIFGHKSVKLPYDDVEFISKTTKVNPAKTNYIYDVSLMKGVECLDVTPISGKTVELYRQGYINGVQVDNKLVGTSYYKTRDAVVRVGL
ncbi:hypothetical protein AN639_04060 [Candidatus Epulonipiscium fishelsonii]|uniref:Uncharacterized protein n=1 Tax=Candidatus Epulonipiscium fishelsonii TaxID=77094 RepID=A0ACC8X816_9FIRM|nr:hypothetical protein AN396_11720 [Epulopiscium sp. SCG-B11WGA-EpuloA1]ONI41147.1 hypothetical protein AN639_04060 [Epulopiscium sp. SCG-B05WGA-EpuloA1]